MLSIDETITIEKSYGIQLRTAKTNKRIYYAIRINNQQTKEESKALFKLLYKFVSNGYDLLKMRRNEKETKLTYFKSVPIHYSSQSSAYLKNFFSQTQ